MKRIISLLISVVLISGMFVTAHAANQLSGAKSYTLNTQRSGSILESKPTSIYKFTLNNPGRLDVDFAGDMQWIYLKIYDANGKELWEKNPSWNSTTEEISFQESVYLCKGDYYFSVSKDGSRYGNFSFTLTKNSIYETFSDRQSNNSTKTASPISLKKEYIGCLAINDDCDVYKFNLPSSGKLAIDLAAEMQWVYLKIYDAKGVEIWGKNPSWNSTTEEISFQENVYLCKGDYYFSVSRDGSRYGKYYFTFRLTSSNETFTEEQKGSNNKVSVASSISVNKKYTAFLALNDTVDIYKVNIYNSEITLNAKANMKYVYLKLYNKNGKEIWSRNPSWNTTTEEISFNQSISLTPGEYYFSVSKDNSYGAVSFYFTNGGHVSEPAPQLSKNQAAMYAPDGRIQIIDKSQVKAWEKVGWYSYPVATMYSLDGRYAVVSMDAVEAWKNVGWYTYPAAMVYAPDGRSQAIARSSVDAWVATGWYTVPVTTLYAPNGKTAVVAKTDVRAWEKVGWYTVPVVTLHAPDGRSVVVAQTEAYMWRRVGWR